MKFPEILSSATDFAARLDRIKQESTPSEWGWYPYKMLPAFLEIFDRLLTGENRQLIETPPKGRIADIGCADGDLGFFLEAIGFQVDFVDYGHYSMQHVATLGKALNSNARTFQIDLDRDFELPQQYELAFCLGLLYHLKNPFRALETLGRHVAYCVISTKTAQRMRGARVFGVPLRVDVSQLPVAYLFDVSEVHPDVHPCWVFTEAGLKRILRRSGWRILDYLTVGNIPSEPTSAMESRAWCLLRSETYQGSGSTNRA